MCFKIRSRSDFNDALHIEYNNFIFMRSHPFSWSHYSRFLFAVNVRTATIRSFVMVSRAAALSRFSGAARYFVEHQ